MTSILIAAATISLLTECHHSLHIVSKQILAIRYSIWLLFISIVNPYLLCMDVNKQKVYITGCTHMKYWAIIRDFGMKNIYAHVSFIKKKPRKP